MPQRLAGVLHRLRARAVDADLADDVEDEVLRFDPLLETVVIDEFQRLRNAKPQLAKREHAGEIGGADAGREVVERAVRAAVRVGADDELAGQHEAVLRQHRVADSALADLEVPLDAHVVRELAREPAEGGAGRVLGGLEVILGHRDALGVPDLLRPHLLAHDPARGRDRQVVAHREIDLGQDEVARADALAPRPAGQDLLGHRHAHQSLNLLATASPHSLVDRLPPRSRVHSRARMTDSTAPSIASAISG